MWEWKYATRPRSLRGYAALTYHALQQLIGTVEGSDIRKIFNLFIRSVRVFSLEKTVNFVPSTNFLIFVPPPRISVAHFASPGMPLDALTGFGKRRTWIWEEVVSRTDDWPAFRLATVVIWWSFAVSRVHCSPSRCLVCPASDPTCSHTHTHTVYFNLAAIGWIHRTYTQ